ncbi:hypothetical protein KBD71_05565 [Candidatus Woesebacteria bacterium]|nr:hypothetical protein [Candidatus Woesebacteria bacterium]
MMPESIYRLITAKGVTITDQDLYLSFVNQAKTTNPDAAKILKQKRPVALEYIPVVPLVGYSQRNDPQRGWVNDQGIYRIPDVTVKHQDFPSFEHSLIFQVRIAQASSILIELSVSHALSSIKDKLKEMIPFSERQSLLLKEKQIIYNYQTYLAQHFGRRS